MEITNWRDILLTIREKWYMENYAAARDHGAPKPGKPYEDKTANGLTRCIYDFLKFKGHYVNRINTQGQVRVERVVLAGGSHRDNVRWTKGQTNRGTADLDSIINGKPVKIEVKVGKDRLSNEQRDEASRITKAGGYYYVAKDMPSFLAFYYMIPS